MSWAPSEMVQGLASSIDHIGGMVLDPYSMLDLPAITDDDLRLGYLLGLLDDSSLVGVEKTRRELGLPQSPLQKSLADTPVGDYTAREQLFSEGMDDQTLLATPALRRWLLAVLRLLLVKWSAGGDPQFEAPDFLDAWGFEGQEVWVRIRPRGIDALVFGAGARKRMLARLRGYLDSSAAR